MNTWNIDLVSVKHACAIGTKHTLIAVNTYLSFFTSCYQLIVTYSYSHTSSLGVIESPLGVSGPEELVATPKPEENNYPLVQQNHIHVYHDNNM